MSLVNLNPIVLLVDIATVACIAAGVVVGIRALRQRS